ncbi:MAG TPA: alpha/beta hydrolase-fold protein [Ktedonobacteraceae bacterium]|nr:alpha/beta hydrolase-fold protein [Ktedonobacteraceae bacterium]
MKTQNTSFNNHSKVRQLLPVISFLISFFVTILCGLLLTALITGTLTATIGAIGLDPLRTQLLIALLFAAGSALAGTLVERRKLGAIMGAGVVFCFGYLLPFLKLEAQPVHDPGGHLEPLNTGVLIHTAFAMLALALLSAFIGAASGAALNDVVLDPLYQLIKSSWQHLAKKARKQENTASLNREGTRTSPPHRYMAQHISSWLAAISMLVILILASSASDLFIYSPDVGLHTAPTLDPHNGTPAHGTIVQDSMSSPTLGGQQKSFLVYLPPSYTTQAGSNRHYPTLYLLHGSPGGESDWVKGGKINESADTLIDAGLIPELIIVMPDGNGRVDTTSEWGNSFDQRQRMETYVVHDLVTYIDQHYRTIPDAPHRGIGGLSMGGFGAMNIAIHHPDVFGTVISLGGYYRAEGAIWGNNAAYIRENSPIDVLPNAPQSWKLHIFLGAATQDQPYYADTQQFMHELDLLHIPYHFDLEHGYHQWSVWQVQMYHALTWLKWG